MDEMTMRVREVERRFLRRAWWVFPVAGVCLSMLTGGGFWAWVEGEAPWLDWRQAFTLRAVLLAGAGLAVAGMWRWLLLRTWRWRAMALAVLAGFAAAEGAVRIPAAQAAFWLAVRARNDSRYGWFLSDTCYIRLEEAAGRGSDAPALVLAGTSQMTCGVDELALGRMLAPTAVIRREVSGMVPQSMLSAWSWMPFRKGDRCVQMRSEMDFTNQHEWRTSWYRPFLTWRTLPWLARNAGTPTCRRHWDELPDCAAAATLEGWRMRDGWRKIVMNPWRRVPETAGEAGEGKADGSKEIPLLTWSDWEWSAFVTGAEWLKKAGVELWVIEGDVNPVLHDARRAELRAEFERRMAEGVEKGLWRFVTEAELDAGIEAEDWQDMTHVNAVGREKLTRAMGRVLRGR